MAVINPPSRDPTRSAVVGVTDAVAAARRELATQWMGLRPADVQRHYADRLGDLHRLISRSGLRDSPTSQTDRAFMAKITAALAAMPRGQVAPGKLLAAMLFLFPHELPCGYELHLVPPWLALDYLAYMLTGPEMFREAGEAAAYCAFAARWTAYLHDAVRANPLSESWRTVARRFMQTANFIPLYFNTANVRDLYVKRAGIIEAALAALDSPLDCGFGPRTGRRRLRLGILAAHFGSQTETFATLPVYRYLDRAKFEVVLFALRRTDHPVEKFCTRLADRLQADRLIVLPEALGPRVQAIRQADLDLVILGTNTTAAANGITLTGAHRLARVQVASVCSCTTTGLRNLDYYLSGRLSEPADAQSHYSEKLVMIDGPAHCYDFSGEPVAAPTETVTRESFGIPPDAVVLGSGANFYKILPEVEEIWIRILAAVPKARLILYPFNPNWSNAYPVAPFMERLSAAMLRNNVDPDRVIVLSPAPNKADVLQRLRLCDVYLDSFPFSGATSLLDPLEVGLPTVVMDGTSFRALVGPALLRGIGMDELIAADPDAYMALAIKLAGDAALRAGLGSRIREKMKAGPPFLDGKLYGAQIGSALEQMWQEYESGGLGRSRPDADAVLP
jgi:predicted O-linked N-acetylglucosamine transferase (SPINDLY family)